MALNKKPIKILPLSPENVIEKNSLVDLTSKSTYNL